MSSEAMRSAAEKANPVWATIAAFETRMEGIEAGVDDLVITIGKPGGPDGTGATGIFVHLAQHERRIRTFERVWERAVGGIMVGTPMVIALWWLGGDKIAHLFHG